MKEINLEKNAKDLLIPNIVNLVSLIHEYKGKQALYIESKRDSLTNLLNIAKIQSTEYSNKIEGISVSDKKIKELMEEKTKPKNRNEEEIAGYRDVLNLIHENYDNISITPNVILQLHKNLYKYSSSAIGGKFKSVDNFIEEIDEFGNKKIRFTPMSAVLTPMAIEDLCNSYNNEIDKGIIDPLILIPIFILDFLSIHPFTDGNGRMSRLLTLLLLYKNGYIVGKYISIEKIVENTKESYYDALNKSSNYWHDNKNDYSYFVSYYLGILLSAYKDFSTRIEYMSNKKMTAKEKTFMAIKNNISKISKKQIVEICPDISETSIERSLKELLNENKIIKIGNKKDAAYLVSTEK